MTDQTRHRLIGLFALGCIAGSVAGLIVWAAGLLHQFGVLK